MLETESLPRPESASTGFTIPLFSLDQTPPPEPAESKTEEEAKEPEQKKQKIMPLIPTSKT